MDHIKELLTKIKWSHILLLIIAYAAYSFYFQDYSEIDIKQTKQVELRKQIDIFHKKVAEAKEFEKKMEEKKANLVELETKLRSKKAELPKTFNVPELLSDIFMEAQQVGLEVLTVTPDANETKYELYASLRIEIQAKSTFMQLFIFLDRLSKLKRLVGVSNVQAMIGNTAERLALKGTTVAMSGKKLTGGDKTYRAISTKITLLAYRII